MNSRPNRQILEADQLARLSKLLSTLHQSNPFYSKKMDEAGVRLPLAGLSEFFSSFPFTTKQEVVEDQAKHPPYGTNLTYPLERYTRFSQTSATTGTPLRWLDTPESWAWMVENWMQVLRVAKAEAGEPVFFAFSFGPFLGFWVGFDAAQKLGCLCIPGGGMSSVARLQAILDNQVKILCCTPTYAIRLADVAEEENIDLGRSSIRAIITGGEPGSSIPATRSRIEKSWPGARVYDHHGMTEIGPVSYECPKKACVLHVIESAFIPEIIDPETGQPVDAGETGELVLTNLGRTGSPLLRYRTGDMVRTGDADQCVCGSYDLALEGGVLGRSDDMVVVRGVNVYPGAVEDVIRSFQEVAEYRVEILSDRTLGEIRIQVESVSNGENNHKLAAQIEKALRASLSLRIPVETVPFGTLPRFEMKAKRWVKV